MITTTLKEDLVNGIKLPSNLEIRINEACTQLSINNFSDPACVLDFELEDGKLVCTYFDFGVLESAGGRLSTEEEVQEEEQRARRGMALIAAAHRKQ
jgi:hypothetical protein